MVYRSMLLAMVLSLVLPASPAGATVSCVQDEFGQPFITLTAPGDRVEVRVGPGGAIQFDGGPGFVSCGTATVSNTDTVTITDTSGGATSAVIALSGGPFAPGFGDEPGNSGEIEFSIRLGGQHLDTVAVNGTDGDDLLVAGAGGINLNPAESTGVDADVLLDGVKEILLSGRDGDDQLRGTGGFGTGGDVAGLETFNLHGGPDRDVLRGSDEMGLQCRFDPAGGFGGTLPQEFIYGEEGNDRINGGERGDCSSGGPGDDVVQGSGGRDAVMGGAAADTVAGGDSEDQVHGDRGDDRLFGQGGNDRLNGGPDDDRCRGGPGGDDFRNCEDLA